MYNNQYALSKQEARTKVLAFSLDIKQPNLLSLPADNFIYEEAFKKQHPDSYIETVEYDPIVFSNGLEKAKSLQIKHHNQEVFKYLNSNKKYDVIWLDLCGYLSNNTINNLIPIVQGRNTNKETILALTVMAKREKLAKHADVYNFKSLKEFRTIGLNKNLETFANMNNCEFKTLDFYSYKGDKNKSADMNLYINKIIKN